MKLRMLILTIFIAAVAMPATAMVKVWTATPPASPASGFVNWWRRLTLRAKGQSTIGTIRRIWRNHLHKPLKLTPMK